MINYRKTLFPHLRKYYLEKLGSDLGGQFFEKSEIQLNILVGENNDRNNKYIRWHLHKNMLPVIAVYLVLKECKITSDDALKYTDEIMQIARLKGKKKNQFIGKMPMGYKMFKTFSKLIVSKQYPTEGWDVEWITINDNEVHFDMKTCIYVEITNKYNCPELCHLFCANDDVTLSGFQPNIIFKRDNTIARGQGKCDFHFYNSNNR